MSNEQPDIKKLNIDELVPFVKRIEVTFRVIDKGEKRDITSKRSGETHTLSNIRVADETASVILTLWDEDIDVMEEGKTYTISNGYVNVFQNSLRLAKGKYGILTEAEQTIDEDKVNLDYDMSESYIDAPRPRRYHKQKQKKKEKKDFGFKSTSDW